MQQDTNVAKLSIDNKTVANLREEIRLRAHYFCKKYHEGFKVNTPLSTLKFYRGLETKYFAISTMLQHLLDYNGLSCPEKCHNCKHDDRHVKNMHAYHNQYKKIISKCLDGYRFSGNYEC